MSDDKKKVVIEFDNEEMARAFAIWLCEGGEQDYWEWRDSDAEGQEHYANNFDYFSQNNGEFGVNIRATRVT